MSNTNAWRTTSEHPLRLGVSVGIAATLTILVMMRRVMDKLWAMIGVLVGLVGNVRMSLALSWRAVVWVAAAVGAVGALSVVLSAVIEDVVASNGLERADLTDVQLVAEHRIAPLTSIAVLLDRLGSVPVLVLLGVAIAVFLWWRGERIFVAATPLVALMAAGVVTGVGKQLIDRPRPPTVLHLVTETGASFPSGHSGDSAALLAAAALVIAITCVRTARIRALIVLAPGAGIVAIGASRVVLGVHYPTDVLAGWLLGAICALVISTAALLIRQRVTARPPQTPDNVALRAAQAIAMVQRSPTHLMSSPRVAA